MCSQLLGEVLDELRPYLKSDGGDCKIIDIDGSVVKLELIGACSSCSASSVTMKMGIEKTLKERIPEVSEVVSVDQEQEPLTHAGVEEAGKRSEMLCSTGPQWNPTLLERQRRLH